MPAREFHAYAGLLAVSGLVLLALAVRGLDQRAFARLLDGVAGLGLLGGAAYLLVGSASPGRGFYGVFAMPVLLLVLLGRERRRARRGRLAAGINQQRYAAPAPATPLTPFPPPPPPLDAAAARVEPVEEEHHRVTYEPLPSGLPPSPGRRPPSPHASPSAAASPAASDESEEPTLRLPPRGSPAAEGNPSGDGRWPVNGPPAPLPGWETFRHTVGPQIAGHDTAAVQETSSRLRQPAYLDDPRLHGRHRASEPGRPDDPADHPDEGPPHGR